MATDTARRLARLTVDLSALCANWRVFAKLAGDGEAAAVVKADGYGLGAREAATALALEGARTFFVATVPEALDLRETLGDAHAIYVLNGPSRVDVGSFAPARLFPVLNSLEQIGLWKAAGAGVAAALHIDTGMNRLGLPLADVGAAQTALARTDVPLVISHLACASDPAHPQNAVQRDRFIAAASAFPGARKSLAATAGVQTVVAVEPDARPQQPEPEIVAAEGAGEPALAAVATLDAPILQLREIAVGDTVGYGATFAATAPLRTATIALGYADGYLRAASGRGYGVLAGAKCRVLGRVSMDLITLDVTAAGGAAEVGALVEMLGPNVPLRDVAAAAGTATYEVLTNLSGAARRHVRGAA